MLQPLIQPKSKYAPSPLVDLSDPETRAVLSKGAFRAFLNITQAWGLKDPETRALLGDMSNGSFYALKKSPDKPLDSSKLRRISYVVGIFKSLNILHGEDLADRWIKLPNSNRIFGGLSPLDYMVKGGLPAFETVRRLLDARRGGQ